MNKTETRRWDLWQSCREVDDTCTYVDTSIQQYIRYIYLFQDFLICFFFTRPGQQQCITAVHTRNTVVLEVPPWTPISTCGKIKIPSLVFLLSLKTAKCGYCFLPAVHHAYEARPCLVEAPTKPAWRIVPYFFFPLRSQQISQSVLFWSTLFFLKGYRRRPSKK